LLKRRVAFRDRVVDVDPDVYQVLVAGQELARGSAHIFFAIGLESHGHAPDLGDRHALDAVETPRQSDPQSGPRFGDDLAQAFHDRTLVGADLMNARQK
jgi:hypothetical protein